MLVVHLNFEILPCRVCVLSDLRRVADLAEHEQPRVGKHVDEHQVRISQFRMAAVDGERLAVAELGLRHRRVEPPGREVRCVREREATPQREQTVPRHELADHGDRVRRMRSE